MIDYEKKKEYVHDEIKRLEILLKFTKKEHLRNKILKQIDDYKTSLSAIEIAKKFLTFTKL